MPQAKPIELQTRHSTKAEKAERVNSELSLSPIQDLPELPVLLKGHAVAADEWRYLMQLYSELSAEVVSSLDLRLLTDYCLMVEQIGELDKLRAAAYKLYAELEKKQAALAKRKKALDGDSLAGSIGYIADAVIKIDARVDRKRALLHTLSQSLYLTPRARAGYVPPKKAAPIPRNEMDEILGTLE